MKDLPLLESRAMERLEEWGGPQMQRKMIEIFLVRNRALSKRGPTP